MTTLTPADFANASTLAEAARVLKREYRGHERLWASWGDYDRNQLQRCCQESDVAYPFGGRHLNVKTLFAGEKLEGTHHRGVDDAWNIAGLLCRLLRAIRG